ncbi:helix-turn-helix domain-containing protein [Actinocrispum wychmicini]|uniref:Helix-turn-helix protein n=1 Tax=Actinocrispum wychmicini TaxID=1213861 RepID=A0A4R2J5G6_9PSEU|nr:helix-turn-helix transcriptional regulator [Actinocrispum wychmicini]TCO52622.1 helix-turn-helix protein [Actinocrispum wychmicini]
MSTGEELGAFLRARRARVRPGDVGLPAGPGLRRTPGLRREELAALSGVSIDYYTRIEQGKETNPSSEVLDALAAALRLDEDSHDHLYKVANQAARRTRPARRSPNRSVRPAVRLLLDSIRPFPAYVLNRVSDVLAANPETFTLFAGLGDWPAERRNTIRYVFRHPAARDLFLDWEQAASTGVANLRAVLGDDPEAPGLADLVAELTAESPEFVRLWRRYDVEPRRSHVKRFGHPMVGTMTLTHEVLRLSDDGQRLCVYQATPGTPDHDALTLLAMTRSPEPSA